MCNVFIYRHDEPSPTGNVFATFADAYTARIAFHGYAEFVYDDTLSPGSAIVPSGTYDWQNTLQLGVPQAPIGSSEGPNGGTFVTLQNGVVFKNWRMSRDLFFHSVSSSAIVVDSGINSNQDMMSFDNVWLQASGSAPFMHFTGAATNQLNVQLHRGSRFRTGTQPVMQWANWPAFFWLDGMWGGTATGDPQASTIEADTILDNGSASAEIWLDEYAVFSPPQSGFTGTLNVHCRSPYERIQFNSDFTMTDVFNDFDFVFFGLTATHSLTLTGGTSPFGRSQTVTVTDGDGSLGAHGFNIIGDVNGAGNYAMGPLGARGSVTLRRNGLGWSIIGIYP